MDPVDVAVIGGGPAGYAAALRARHRGLSAVLVEDRDVGGVCLNRGCIPTKVMLHFVEVAAACELLSAEGVLGGPAKLDYAGAVARRRHGVEQLRGGVHTLLRAAGVKVLDGRGQLRDGMVHVTGVEEETDIRAGHVILATGSSPSRPPIEGIDLPGVVDSDGALTLTELPQRVLIVGGGAVGCEWAAVLRGFGVQVVLIESLDRLLPTEDASVGRVLEQSLVRHGVDVRRNTPLSGIELAGSGLAATVEGEQELVDLVLVAAGRSPNADGLGLAEHGVLVDDKGFVKTNETTVSSVSTISAVGDLAGGPLLAHAATHEAHVAVDRLAGLDAVVSHDLVPSVTYTSPEVATVGLTLDAARQHDDSSEAHAVPFAAIGRAVASGRHEGFAQLVTSGAHGRVVGGQIVGPGAGDLIGEVALAIELETTLEDVAATVHPHPTHIEILHEAALLGLGVPLHVTRSRPRNRS